MLIHFITSMDILRESLVENYLRIKQTTKVNLKVMKSYNSNRGIFIFALVTAL